uniref:C2H2-type domain-containing protein n=1 Tax=Araucaria cunninghamii TaxID=56994 RepID=A0A0D6R5I3_ARACU
MAAAARAERDPRFHDDDNEEEDNDLDTVAGEVDTWDDWVDDDDSAKNLCLFCNTPFPSADSVFQHCSKDHAFDFSALRKSLALDFYGSFKLINYIRSQVAENRCWSCGFVQDSNEALLEHLHTSNHLSVVPDSRGDKNIQVPWQEDGYLTPFLQEDPLLYSFDGEEDTMGSNNSVEIYETEELIKELQSDHLTDLKGMVESSSDDDELSDLAPKNCCTVESTTRTINTKGTNWLNNIHIFGPSNNSNSSNGEVKPEKNSTPSSLATKDKKSKVTFANVAKKEIKNINESYFGAYGRFGIHREMLSDQVRMDAYRGAILNNRSLFNKAVVMDVGCGTGILSLFAAQAGASKVIAVEASQKMASVARQVAKANNMLNDQNENGVITVVEGMIEELDNQMPTESHSVDVIVSEWMGYCLLYESMLSSVLYARDHWLNPGGAILPDTAEMYVAGFGKGGTSLPFWENVYGFNMSCIGKEVVDDATELPIVDILESKDIVTETSSLHAFDLMTMKSEEMDFTTTFELKPKFQKQSLSAVSEGILPEGYREATVCNDFKDLSLSGTIWCYGLVLWFETSFTSRFCKEMPTVLSTSPYKPNTHWSQTLLTFKEPIALSSSTVANLSGSRQAVGTESSPASFIKGRISIARSFRYRSIDISVEAMAVGANDEIRVWPVQIFNI